MLCRSTWLSGENFYSSWCPVWWFNHSDRVPTSNSHENKLVKICQVQAENVLGAMMPLQWLLDGEMEGSCRNIVGPSSYGDTAFTSPHSSQTQETNVPMSNLVKQWLSFY